MTVANAAPPGLLPCWTVPSFTRSRGRYPLGTEAVALNQMATELASGLPVLSRHPRYWSLYPFLIKRYWDSGRTPQTNAALGRYLKRREPVFALAALRCPRHRDESLQGVIGSTALTPWANGTRTDPLPLDVPYLQQALGGYGQVYRGALMELGLILQDVDNPRARLDAPFGELGAAVAEQFAAAIAGTTYARRYLDRDEGAIPLPVIDELGEASCFCRLVDHVPERDLLTGVLLGREQAPHPAHRQRAATVRMYLDLAAATDGQGLDEARYRQLLYFGVAGDARWPRTPAVEETRRRWWLVQHREFVVGALNGLFTHVVRWGIAGGGTLRPLGVADYAARLAALRLPPLGDLPAGTAAEVAFDDVVAALDAVAARGGWPVEPAAAGESLNEAALARLADFGRADDAPVAALLTLLLAWRRIALARDHAALSADEERLLRDGGLARLATHEVCARLEHHAGRGRSLADALLDAVRVMVIHQHLHVARGKLPLETFRFYEDAGGGLRFVDQHDDGVSPISIRYDAIGGALHGLGLIAGPPSASQHGPTARGREVLDG